MEYTTAIIQCNYKDLATDTFYAYIINKPMQTDPFVRAHGQCTCTHTHARTHTYIYILYIYIYNRPIYSTQTYIIIII